MHKNTGLKLSQNCVVFLIKFVDKLTILRYYNNRNRQDNKERKRTMKKAFFENIQFVTLVLLIVAQCVVGSNFYVGQFIYLGANTIASTRDFVLNRSVADKVKDLSCLAITIGLIFFNFFKENS